MTQNTSHAVMSQRHEAHDSLDHFPTPPWATRALCEWLDQGTDEQIQAQTCWEPACAEGHMSRALAEYFAHVISTDVYDYGFGDVDDFLFPSREVRCDWIITNPPFRLGQQFARAAIDRALVGSALLVRVAFLESADRYSALYRGSPPSDILQFVERVPMFKGRLDRHGSTATAYCWLVWRKGESGRPTHFHWITPCRRRLERDSDYLQRPVGIEAAE
jgi:hypothetical protein